AALAIPERTEHALDDLGPRVCMGEELAGADDVRLHERAPARTEIERFHRPADDLPDPLRVVGLAVEEEDAGVPVRVLGGHAPAGYRLGSRTAYGGPLPVAALGRGRCAPPESSIQPPNLRLLPSNLRDFGDETRLRGAFGGV